jgi:hypothetical protein
MQTLNLPQFNFNIRQKDSYKEIFDISRKKFVKLTPEEWVRQNFLMFLISVKNFPDTLITVEKSLKYNKLAKKADILVYDNTATPRILVECKASHIKISQNVFAQIARYNFALKVDYLIVTNGIDHYCCKMDYTNNSFEFVEDIPDYRSLEFKV